MLRSLQIRPLTVGAGNQSVGDVGAGFSAGDAPVGPDGDSLEEAKKILWIGIPMIYLDLIRILWHCGQIQEHPDLV